MESTLEADWITKAGLRAVCRLVRDWRCGYVCLPPTNPNYKIPYNDLDVEVHGGLTFGDEYGDYPVLTDSKEWWVGFDCNHSWDQDDRKTLEYVKNECESLAEQLTTRRHVEAVHANP